MARLSPLVRFEAHQQSFGKESGLDTVSPRSHAALTVPELGIHAWIG